MIYNIWYEKFLVAQVYPMKSNILCQDNEAAEKMAKNVKNSCSSKSRNIIIKLF